MITLTHLTVVPAVVGVLATVVAEAEVEDTDAAVVEDGDPLVYLFPMSGALVPLHSAGVCVFSRI